MSHYKNCLLCFCCTCVLQICSCTATAKFSIYSARNARIASAVLATAIRLSVCPSATRQYCVKTTARSTVQFAPVDSKMCLVL